MVDKDRISGAAKQVKGSVKAKAGKVAGDPKLHGEGKSEKARGKAQSAVGSMKDKVRETID